MKQSVFQQYPITRSMLLALGLLLLLVSAAVTFFGQKNTSELAQADSNSQKNTAGAKSSIYPVTTVEVQDVENFADSKDVIVLGQPAKQNTENPAPATRRVHKTAVRSHAKPIAYKFQRIPFAPPPNPSALHEVEQWRGTNKSVIQVPERLGSGRITPAPVDTEPDFPM